jgi:hypothetical protein
VIRSSIHYGSLDVSLADGSLPLLQRWFLTLSCQDLWRLLERDITEAWKAGHSPLTQCYLSLVDGQQYPPLSLSHPLIIRGFLARSLRYNGSPVCLSPCSRLSNNSATVNEEKCMRITGRSTRREEIHSSPGPPWSLVGSVDSSFKVGMTSVNFGLFRVWVIET